MGTLAHDSAEQRVKETGRAGGGQGKHGEGPQAEVQAKDKIQEVDRLWRNHTIGDKQL